MRRALVFTCAFVGAMGVALVVSAGASAQHCAAFAPSLSTPLGLRVGLNTEFATYRTARFEGDYQGIGFDASWQHRWVRLRASVLAYRLVRNGIDVAGVGDLLLDVKVPLAYLGNDALVLGVGMASTLPFGDADDDLGMGHVMLMPGLWMDWQSDHLFFNSQVSFGQALSSHNGAHHGGGPGPIVNPMNATEVEAALTAGLKLHPSFHIHFGVYGAVPVAVDSGASRAVTFAGIEVTPADWLDLSLQHHLPLAGDPFLAKIVLQAGARF